jgi:hypothetical protein
MIPEIIYKSIAFQQALLVLTRLKFGGLKIVQNNFEIFIMS